jgi:hypothetical protein
MLRRGLPGCVWPCVALAACLLGCAPDDGFRARLAMGCVSDSECESLAALARARYLACVSNGAGGNACPEERKDKFAANALRDSHASAAARDAQERSAARSQQRADIQAQRDAADAARQKLVDDANAAKAAQDATLARYSAAIGAYPSCEQLNANRAEATSVTDPILGPTYRNMVEQKRAVMVSDMTRLVHTFANEPRPDLTQLPDPTTAAADVARAREIVDRMRCYDAESATKAQAEVDGWALPLDSAIVDELDCRASTKCMGARAAAARAEATKVARETAKAAAAERAASQPSGGGSARCCDGAISPTCGCGGGRGCCSHHGGVCGCAN